MAHNHTVGDIVEVFDDPITKEDKQGNAKIVFVTETAHYYKVIFVLDPEAERVGRFIY